MTSQSADSGWDRPGGSGGADQGRTRSAHLVDPADDLPSVDYTGDFETTKIPSYDVANSSIVGADHGSSGGEHPLHYAQRPPAGPGSVVDYDTGGTGNLAAPGTDRRGTQDLGLLILRLGLGAVLIAHGLQKALGWWGGQGLAH
ncbi:MAG TPA: hypothetical protein VF299_00470, partial [Mycobacterium sp.]